MHCDDKRTEYALKQFVIEATRELHDLKQNLTGIQDNKEKTKIQERINYLEKSISDSKDQLSTMH